MDNMDLLDMIVVFIDLYLLYIKFNYIYGILIIIVW